MKKTKQCACGAVTMGQNCRRVEHKVTRTPTGSIVPMAAHHWAACVQYAPGTNQISLARVLNMLLREMNPNGLRGI